MKNENRDENFEIELTPEQQAAIEANVRKTVARLERGKKIWNKIKTPLLLGGAAVGGFVLRGALSRNECPFDKEETDEDFEDTYDDEE